MKLSTLLEAARPLIEETPICHPALSIDHDPEIRSIHYRAQEVTPGGLFVAVPGLAADGHDFIDQALERGAAAILVQQKMTRDTTVVTVSSTRKALGGISSAFFGRPSERLCIIGITGTNGKTTTAYLVESILAAAGHKVGLMGTIDYHYDGSTYPNPVTTPESLDVQRILSQMRDSGVTHVVMEISSHAIDLLRIRNCYLDVGVFTNLSQDHLDYHGDMDAYWQCKKKLFTLFLNQGPKKSRARAVINLDTEKGRALLETLEMPCIGVGGCDNAVIRPADISHALEGIRGTIHTPAGSFAFSSPLVGRHNLENILCAVGVGVALKIDLAAMGQGIQGLSYVPGRLEPVALGNWDRFVVVDYAHTPDALENVIRAIRAVTSGRIICIFGCGGDRDRSKRPRMGEIAGRLSDFSVITSDNPRTEDPLMIIEGIVDGVLKTGARRYGVSDLGNGFAQKGYCVEADRRRAIHMGIRASRPGDVVLIAGKGHENYQVIGRETVDFDDKQVAEKAMGEFQALQKSRVQGFKPTDLIPWTVADILDATGGTLVSGSRNHCFKGVGIDSRTITGTDLFVAIEGAVHDGHCYAADVIDSGIQGLVVARDKISTLPCSRWQKGNVVCIAVPDTTRALGNMAAFNRQRAHVSVVAVTGSNGKTSTRAMITAVISRRYTTLAPKGNFNNEIGLPLTLLQLTAAHQWAVVELGMNHFGEIRRLAEICSPDMGIITNIGPAHIEGVGSMDGVMQAKAELLEKIRPGGIIILNADDPRTLQLSQNQVLPVLLFGMEPTAHIKGDIIGVAHRKNSFVLKLPEEEIRVDLPVHGDVMIANALAAAAVGYQLGFSAGEIKAGLESFQPVPGRMNVLETSMGLNMIDDTYNANPVSMAAAIKTLNRLAAGKPSVMVIGDMLELGDQAKALHFELGQKAGTAGIGRLYSTGDFSQVVVDGALSRGMDARHIFIGSQSDIINDLKGHLHPGHWILIKGSRGMALERTVKEIQNWANT